MKKKRLIVGLILVFIFTYLNISSATNTPIEPSNNIDNRSTAATGNVYYVSPTGNDNNPGTETLPWATPGFGSKQLQEGDTLIIKEGIYVMDTYYEDMITPLVSGTSTSWITIKGEDGKRPALCGKDNLFSAIDISGKSYILIENLEITSYNKMPFRGGIEASGSPIDHIIIKDLYIHHIDEFGINIADVDELKILNCIIEYCGFGAVGGPSGTHGGWRNVLINGCRLSYSGHYYQGGDGNSRPYDRPDGLGIEPSPGPVVIINTTAEHNRGDGLDSKAENTYISNCIVANNSCDGIKLWGTASKIENCLIYGRGDGDTYITPWSPIVIGTEKPYSYFQIINVTVDDYVGNNYLMHVQYDNPIPIDLTVKNTIFCGRGTGNSPIYLGDSVEFNLENNLFYTPNSQYVLAIGDTTYDFTQIQQVGLGNRYGDPLFYQPAFGTTGNYQLQKKSPAIDSGTSIGAPNIDLNYITRPKGSGYDIGAYEKANNLIQPSDLVYLGAFRLPDTPGGMGWEWAGVEMGALTYYPQGDPSGALDGFPGSLYGTGHDQLKYISEINIPPPLISPTKDPEDLNTASTLQDFTDILGDKLQGLELPKVGLAYLEMQDGQTSDKLYYCYGQHIQDEERNPSHGWFELDLSHPQIAGDWKIDNQLNYLTTYYLFSIPREWSDINTPGMYLATGRFRDGGQGSQGPTIFAYGPWNQGNPPVPGTELSTVTLLQYSSVIDPESHVMDNYAHSDEWNGGAWLKAGDRSSVIFVGTKGIGYTWYGYSDGTEWPTSGEGPFPPEPVITPTFYGEELRGWWSESFQAQILFYDPEDLAAVAQGMMQPYEPQPYAVLNIDPYLYNLTDNQQKDRIAAVAYDRERGYLYVLEPLADGDKSIIHVWQITDPVQLGMVVNNRTGELFSTIQGAVDNALEGDTLTAYPGTYTENVTVNRTLTLQSGGVDVFIQSADSGQPVITINSGGSGSVIQGFFISGASSSFGVYLASTNNCQLMGNTLSGNMIGIYIQNSGNNTVSGNAIQSNGWVGLCIDNSSSNTINGGNLISGNGEGVYIVNTSNNNIITGNNIYGNFDAGVNILTGPTGNIISGNTAISNNGVIGVLIRDSDTNTVSGNIIQNNGWVGVTLDNADGNTINESNIISGNLEGLNITNSTGNNINGNSITGNINIGVSLINSSNGNNISYNNISHNEVIGVYLRDSSTNRISSNTIQINSWTGICFDQATGNIIEKSNNISGNLEGLYIVNNSNDNFIQGNNIHENQDTGIYVDGSTGNNITYNTAISSNGVVGILLRRANNNTVTGNIIEHNYWVGIALDNAHDNIINGGNTITGNQEGIYLTNSSGNTIDGNSITYNMGSGINLLANSDTNTLTNNQISYNALMAVFIQNSTSNTVHNNNLQNQGWAGIILETTTNTTIYQNNFINNPLQALAQNGTGNSFYQDATGNYWNDWPSTNPRPIYGNEGLIDQYPSTTPF